MKINLKLLALVLVVAMQCGCEFGSSANSEKPTGKFACYVSENRLFRLNTADGTLYEYRNGRLVFVPSGTRKLTPGEYFEDEKGELFTYKGALKFEKTTADEILSADPVGNAIENKR